MVPVRPVTTSGGGKIYVTDRTTQRLAVVESASLTVVAGVALGASPDYVRYVAARSEVWVTEPDKDQLEIFAVGAHTDKTPKLVTTLAVSGGPESLVIDAQRGRAYTNLWKGKTVAIDVNKRKIVASWPNGCVSSRGIATDPKAGLVFVACAEGKLSVLNAETGLQIASVKAERGVDVIDFNARLRHLYLPGGSSAGLTILRVARDGQLTTLARTKTVSGAHCVTSDAARQVYVCDPRSGSLLVIRDTLP